MFWYKCICLLVDAHKQDYHDKESTEKCLKILNKSIKLVKAEKQKRSNKKDKFEYMEAMFTFRLAQITCDALVKKNEAKTFLKIQ